MSIQIFKKEDPTFDTFKLLEEDRWRVYVSAYTRIPPTDDKLRVKRPFMTSSLRPLIDPSYDNTEERSDEWRRRFQQSVSEEKLVLRISIPQYKLIFERNTEEYHYQPLAIRDNGKEGAEDAEASTMHRADQAQDTLVINNHAMKGLSKEDVEGKNEFFGRVVSEGGIMVGDSSEDSEMEE